MANDAHECQRCAANATTTASYCVACHLVLCRECAGAGAFRTCRAVYCRNCRRDADLPFDATPDELIFHGALVAGVQHIEASRYNQATFIRHSSNLKQFTKYAATARVVALPATQESVEKFISFALVIREPSLDPSSIELIVSAISAWHKQLEGVLPFARPRMHIVNPAGSSTTRHLVNTIVSKFKDPVLAKLLLSINSIITVLDHGFKTATRFGRQHHLFTIFCTFGPLRPNAAAHLIVRYVITDGVLSTLPDSDVKFFPNGDPDHSERFLCITVFVDKNVNPSQPQVRYLPAFVCGVPVYDIIYNYILIERPPSGGYLLAAPKSLRAGSGFRDTPFSAFNENFKSAVATALPELTASDYGGGTPRKSMAQWLNVAGIPRHVIADVCGWARPDRNAMDGYQHTTAEMQMAAKSALPEPHRSEPFGV